MAEGSTLRGYDTDQHRLGRDYRANYVAAIRVAFRHNCDLELSSTVLGVREYNFQAD